MQLKSVVQTHYIYKRLQGSISTQHKQLTNFNLIIKFSNKSQLCLILEEMLIITQGKVPLKSLQHIMKHFQKFGQETRVSQRVKISAVIEKHQLLQVARWNDQPFSVRSLKTNQKTISVPSCGTVITCLPVKKPVLVVDVCVRSETTGSRGRPWSVPGSCCIAVA